MLNLSRLIVVASFLSGAYLASLDRNLVDWNSFIPVVIVGIIGLIMLKRSEKAASQNSDKLTADRAIMEASLKNILKNLEDLDGRKDAVPTYDMRFEIDKIFREDLNNFADARDSMKYLFGLQSYADVMSSFAAGERYLNRVWSASTDGYVDEVLTYVSKARNQFVHALEEWHSAAKK